MSISSPLDRTLAVLTPLAALTLAAATVQAVIAQPMAGWTIASLILFVLLLGGAAAALHRAPRSFVALVATLFASLVLGRLLSTFRPESAATGGSPLDPLLVAETGPGLAVPTFASLILFGLLVLRLFRLAQSEVREGRASAEQWGLVAIRIYVGLMFIAHFAGHLFAGPAPFQVFADYFGSIGLPFASAFVVLAGLIEVAVTLGLALGFMTRIAAVLATVYLFVAVGLGGHYGVGYVRVLPTGGLEFPALWMFGTALFAFTGGGAISLDASMRGRDLPLPRLARLAFA